MNSTDLVNYTIDTADSSDYANPQSTASPESFPERVGNGVYVEYKQVVFASEIIADHLKTEPNPAISPGATCR